VDGAEDGHPDVRRMARKEHILKIYFCCGLIETRIAKGKDAQRIWDEIRFKDGGCWTDYNEGLVRRGCESGGLGWISLIDSELAEMNKGKRGRPYEYPDSMVEYARKRHARDGTDYRTLEGELREIMTLAGRSAISYSQMFKRCKRLDAMGEAVAGKDPAWIRAFNAANRAAAGKGIVAAVDAAGMKITARGEWMREKWKVRRGWVKVHAMVDVSTGKVLSYCVTTEETADSKMLLALVDDAVSRGHALDRVYMDGAYDSRAIWNGLKERGMEMVTNIRRNASTRSLGCPQRAAAVRARNAIGDHIWKLVHRYGRRWRVEGAFSDLKRVMGETLSAKSLSAMAREIDVKIVLHNRFKDIIADAMAKRA
jgi:hypothetical protein